MYGIVLMAALTTGGDVTACHRSYGCAGGCHGYVGSHGGCYGGGYGCSGCYGGGYGCSGCYGGGYGCSGCYGGGYGYSSVVYSCHGCYGCSGCYGCYGGCVGCYGGGVIVTPTMPSVPPIEKAPLPKVDKKGDESVRGRVIIEVPADAVLFIDGVKMKTTSDHRVFTTPNLQPGLTYYYELKAEIVRDGQTLSETSRILVRAGEESRAAFNTLAPNATTRTATRPVGVSGN